MGASGGLSTACSWGGIGRPWEGEAGGWEGEGLELPRRGWRREPEEKLWKRRAPPPLLGRQLFQLAWDCLDFNTESPASQDCRALYPGGGARMGQAGRASRPDSFLTPHLPILPSTVEGLPGIQGWCRGLGSGRCSLVLGLYARICDLGIVRVFTHFHQDPHLQAPKELLAWKEKGADSRFVSLPARIISCGTGFAGGSLIR